MSFERPDVRDSNFTLFTRAELTVVKEKINTVKSSGLDGIPQKQ